MNERFRQFLVREGFEGGQEDAEKTLEKICLIVYAWEVMDKLSGDQAMDKIYTLVGQSPQFMSVVNKSGSPFV